MKSSFPIAIATLSGVLWGCGQVVFIDPDADLKSRLRVTEALRFRVEGDPRVYLHFQISARDPIVSQIQLELETLTERLALPLDTAQRQDCPDEGTCIALTLGPGIPDEPTTVTLTVAEIGHEHIAPVEVISLPRHEISGTARQDNTRVLIDVIDPIRNFFPAPIVTDEGSFLLFPRAFEAAVEPGACRAQPSREDSWLPLSRLPVTLDADFEVASQVEVCVWLRPNLPAGGPPVAATSVAGRAVIESFQHLYTPPVERAPMVFLPFFDLEIPSEARCRAAQGLVQNALLEAAQNLALEEGTEILALDPVDLAITDGIPCRQAASRSFDAISIADQAQEQINREFGPNRRVRMVWVYAANLDIPIPPELALSFNLLRSQFRTARRFDLMIAIAPEEATMDLFADRQLAWIATEEPLFRESIQALLGRLWPFKTVLHTAQTLVPMTEPEDIDRFFAFKVCTASQVVDPIGTPLGTGAAVQAGPFGPAYRVELPRQVLIENEAFALPAVSVQWEGCVKLCDRLGPDDAPEVWELSEGC